LDARRVVEMHAFWDGFVFSEVGLAVEMVFKETDCLEKFLENILQNK